MTEQRCRPVPASRERAERDRDQEKRAEYVEGERRTESTERDRCDADPEYRECRVVQHEHQSRGGSGRSHPGSEAERRNRRLSSAAWPQPKHQSEEADGHNDDREPRERHLAREIGTGERFMSEHDQVREVRSRQE